MKRVLITGASRGIGSAIALEAARRAYDEVIVHYHENHTAADEVCNDIRKMGKAAIPFAANFANADGVDSLIELVRTYKEIHGIVHAAALNVFKPLSALRPNQWDLCLQISTGSFVQIMNAIIPMMPSGSAVVAVSSLGSRMAIPFYGPMGPLKAALEASVRQYAFECAPFGIRVNGIAPGFVRTSSIEKFPNATELIQLASLQTPLENRIAEPDEIAPVAGFLLGDESRWITGQILVVDGGFSLS
ncbi:MAG: SDR family oxidoreductase [bacterium]